MPSRWGQAKPSSPELETVSVSMPAGRRRTAAETSFPASGDVGVATEMLLTKAEQVSSEGGAARLGPNGFSRGSDVSCAWRYAGSELAAGGLN